MIQISQNWKQSYPGAYIGVLVMERVQNPPEHAGLEQIKTQFEASIRSDYGGWERTKLQELPWLRPYVEYYKCFTKTYHVLLQLESVANKGKNLPRVAALVEAMFIAELKNGLLTAGHDLDLVHLPLTADVADGSQSFMQINGQTQTLKPEDMFIADHEGVISSVIYGPDQRTKITPATSRVIFTIYAPAGIDPDLVRNHLADIQQYVQLVSSSAITLTLDLLFS